MLDAPHDYHADHFRQRVEAPEGVGIQNGVDCSSRQFAQPSGRRRDCPDNIEFTDALAIAVGMSVIVDFALPEHWHIDPAGGSPALLRVAAVARMERNEERELADHERIGTRQ
jgi:hypothetical protein